MVDTEEAKTFESLGVCEELVEACKSLGWNTPSRIQAEAIPYALEGLFIYLLWLQWLLFADGVVSALCVCPHALRN